MLGKVAIFMLLVVDPQDNMCHQVSSMEQLAY
jgi:hypothetical protein